jgi:hypothetical protein
MATTQPRPQRALWRRITIGALIGLGLLISFHFGSRAIVSFREIQYIREQGLQGGNARVEAIRSWMTIRFVAVAYAVPEEYLYSALGVAFDRRNGRRTLGEINDDYQFGQSPNGRYPAILDTAQAAITAYRANPVVTGLRDVRPWMSVRYIANSSGVAADTIFAQLNLPMEGNADKPLDLLSDEQAYPGGPRALSEAIQGILAAQQGAP